MNSKTSSLLFVLFQTCSYTKYVGSHSTRWEMWRIDSTNKICDHFWRRELVWDPAGCKIKQRRSLHIFMRATKHRNSTDISIFKHHDRVMIQVRVHAPSSFHRIQMHLFHSLFFPFHMSDHHLAKGLSLSSVHASGIHSPLIPETHLLYQYSVPDSKPTSSKLRSLPRLFPISLDCLPGFWFLLFSFYALSNDT